MGGKFTAKNHTKLFLVPLYHLNYEVNSDDILFDFQTRSSTGENMTTPRQEPTVYLLSPQSTRPDWRTCCQTLTTSSRSGPSTEPAWGLLENTARCSPRDHVRGRQETETLSCCHNQIERQLLLLLFFFCFCLQLLQTLPGCGATSPGLESGCTCGGTISSTTGLGIFPSRCITRWVRRTLKLSCLFVYRQLPRKVQPLLFSSNI